MGFGRDEGMGEARGDAAEFRLYILGLALQFFEPLVAAFPLAEPSGVALPEASAQPPAEVGG